MCGRYASSRRPDDLRSHFGVTDDRSDIGPGDGQGPPEPDWNVAPTKPVLAVLERRPPEAPGAPPARQLRALRWGLVPSWAKDMSIGSRLVNARLETLTDKPAFRRAFARRRCLLPADGYYEWYAGTAAAGRRTGKQPFFLTQPDGEPLAMAGLYEVWRDPAAGKDAPLLWTSTVITTAAPDDLGVIHDRMPLLVPRQGWARWLDPGLEDPGDLADLLVPARPGLLDARPVSTEVNDVRHNGPQLVEPLPEPEQVSLHDLERGLDQGPEQPTLF